MDSNQLATLAKIVFLISAGLNYLAPHNLLRIIAGVSGLLLGIIILSQNL